jgi:hypothetical protein
MEGIKEDLAWLPSFDPEFERYVVKPFGLAQIQTS